MKKYHISQLPEELYNVIKISEILFRMSFYGGTILMFIHFIIPEMIVLLIGFVYVVIAFCINLIMLACLLIYSCIYWQYRITPLLRAGLLLINIPVALLYLYLVSEFSKI